MMNKLQLQNLAWTSTSKSWPTLCSKSEQMFSFMIKPQLPNLQQTVANTILIINISNSNNSTSFELTSSHARVTSIKSTKWHVISELVTRVAICQWSDSPPIKAWIFHSFFYSRFLGSKMILEHSKTKNIYKKWQFSLEDIPECHITSPSSLLADLIRLLV